MLTRVALLLLVAACCPACAAVPSTPAPGAAVPATPRAALAAALGRVQVGMTAEEVRHLLGPPDDVRTEEDPGGINWAHAREIWGYGTSGHLEFPTSGQVVIDDQGRVLLVFGGQGAPPPPSLLTDEEVRALLRVLARVPSYDGFGAAPGAPLFDPRPLIRAVNALQPLGKDRALAAIGEFVRVAPPWDPAYEGMLLVLRVLFDMPKGGVAPPMVYGARTKPAPEGPLVPRSPIVLAGDIPFRLVDGHRFSSNPPMGPPLLKSHIERFRGLGVIRRAPLHPAADPLAALDAIDTLLAEDFRRADCRDQVAVMLDSILPMEPDVLGLRFSPGDDAPARWAALRRTVAAIHPRWNDRLGTYTFPDGTTLRPAPEVPLRRARWSFAAPCVTGRVVLQRRSRRFAGVEVYVGGIPCKADLTVRVLDVTGGGRRVLLERTFPWSPSGRNVGQNYSTGQELAPGAEVLVERSGR